MRLLKLLLAGAAALQVFLSVYYIYCAVPLNFNYLTLSSLGNLLNIILLVFFGSVLFLEIYVRGRRRQTARRALEYLRPENLLLAAFLLWMYFSGFVNNVLSGGDLMSANASAYSNALVRILLFFMLGQYLLGDKRFLHILFRGLVLCLTAAMIYVLVMLVRYGSFELPNGARVFFTEEITPGMKRLCVNFHPNTTGMYAKTLILLCVYLFALERKKYRFLYLAAAAVHYCILILTSSRAAMVSAGAGVGAVAMLFVWRRQRQKKWGMRLLAALLSFAVVFALFLSLRAPVLESYNRLRGMFYGYESIGEDETEDGEVEFRKMGSDISGRQLLFRAAFQGMRDPKTAFFGVTPDGVTTLIDRMAGIDWHVYTHNEFLEIMCAVGIPGILLFLAWFLAMAWKGFKIFFDAKRRFSFQEGVLVVVCFAEALNNMMEAMMTFSSLLSGIIFYVTAGYLLTDSEKKAGE